MSLHQVNSHLVSSFSRHSEYRSQIHLNLYDSPALNCLATQVLAGRHLRLIPSDENSPQSKALRVCLCEDDYPGWLAVADLPLLQEAREPYQAIALSTPEIVARLPAVIAFAQAAMTQPNTYFWGGTVGPNYDCSGLVQHAFSAHEIWLPRDAYQQEAFTESIGYSGKDTAGWIAQLKPGDLIFFGSPQKATHVGIHLAEGYYIHSSGRDQGRDGIGIDQLSPEADQVSRTYYHQLRGGGRVVASYQPQSLAEVR